MSLRFLNISLRFNRYIYTALLILSILAIEGQYFLENSFQEQLEWSYGADSDGEPESSEEKETKKEKDKDKILNAWLYQVMKKEFQNSGRNPEYPSKKSSFMELTTPPPEFI